MPEVVNVLTADAQAQESRGHVFLSGVFRAALVDMDRSPGAAGHPGP